MSTRVPRDRWNLHAGDGEGYSLILPFDPTDYTGWKAQLRPATVNDPDAPTGQVVDLAVDETALGANPPVIRFTLTGDQVRAHMDGWGGDAEVIAPNGEPLTLVEWAISVDGEYTVR